MAQNSLRTRLGVLRADAPARRLAAERWARSHYRMHRDLPKGATALIPRRRLFRLIALAELEHLIRVAPLLVLLGRFCHEARARWQRLNGAFRG